MDYAKLDAALATALSKVRDSEARGLVVFIHTVDVPGTVEEAWLEKLGISNSNMSGKQIFTATLSAQEIAELSDQPWVQHIRLSQKLRLLETE